MKSKPSTGADASPSATPALSRRAVTALSAVGYLNQQVAVDRIKLESAGELSNIRKSMEQDVREMETKFQNRLETLRDELEKRRKADLQEVDTKNQEHVKNLKANHEKAIIDLKNCYNDIILNNMTLITALKVR